MSLAVQATLGAHSAALMRIEEVDFSRVTKNPVTVTVTHIFFVLEPKTVDEADRRAQASGGGPYEHLGSLQLSVFSFPTRPIPLHGMAILASTKSLSRAVHEYPPAVTIDLFYLFHFLYVFFLN
jgi:hypothetical protein